MTVRQECPSRAVHVTHTHLDGAAVCPGVEAPPEDKAWLALDVERVPASASPFAGLPAVEVWLIFLAQLAGAAVAFLCLRLPSPWGILVFLLVNLALAGSIARILMRGRR